MIRTHSYSIDIAKKFGLHSAAFISYIEKVYYSANLENKLNQNGGVQVSRLDISANTALEFDKQAEVESALMECGVLSIKPIRGSLDRNYYIFNYSNFDKIMSADSMEDIKIDLTRDFAKASKTKGFKPDKRFKDIVKLKYAIATDDQIVRQYICDWIDAVYQNPGKFLSVPAIKITEQELYKYSNNSETIIDVLKIAIKGGWKDISYAIEKHKSSNNCKIDNNFISYSDIKSDGSETVNEVF